MVPPVLMATIKTQLQELALNATQPVLLVQALAHLPVPPAVPNTTLQEPVSVLLATLFVMAALEQVTPCALPVLLPSTS